MEKCHFRCEFSVLESGYNSASHKPLFFGGWGGGGGGWCSLTVDFILKASFFVPLYHLLFTQPLVLPLQQGSVGLYNRLGLFGTILRYNTMCAYSISETTFLLSSTQAYFKRFRIEERLGCKIYEALEAPWVDLSHASLRFPETFPMFPCTHN